MCVVAMSAMLVKPSYFVGNHLADFFFVTEGMGIAVTKQPIASSDHKSQALALSCMHCKKV